MIERAAIVAQARTWLLPKPTPYMHQQRMKGVGVDCIGLPIGVARELATVEPEFDVTGYSRQPDGTLIARADQYLTRIDIATAQAGDIVAMVVEKEPAHFGILADYRHAGLSLIHALCRKDGKGEVVEHRIDASHRARIVAAWLFPGVA